MKVFEYLIAASDEELARILQSSHGCDHKAAKTIIDEILNIVQAVQVKDEIAGIRIERAISLSGDEFLDVYGVLKNGEDVGITLTPWGMLNHLEVIPDDDITDINEIAAELLWEFTFHGNEEEKIERQFQIDESLAESIDDVKIELKPGIMCTPQVKEILDKHPELKAKLESMSIHDFKNAGRRVH